MLTFLLRTELFSMTDEFIDFKQIKAKTDFSWKQ